MGDLMRAAKTSYKTIHKGLRREPIKDEAAAQRICAATDGLVPVSELMRDDLRDAAALKQAS